MWVLESAPHFPAIWSAQPLSSKNLLLFIIFVSKIIVGKVKDAVNVEDKTKNDIEKKHKLEENAFGTYASKGGEQFVYRVKKEGAFGGYKIVTERTGSALSREELLDMRKKKKSDR